MSTALSTRWRTFCRVWPTASRPARPSVTRWKRSMCAMRCSSRLGRGDGTRCAEKRSKHQDPSSRETSSLKLQTPRAARLSWCLELFLTQQFVRFGSKHKIALGEAIDFVGPDREFHLTPGEVNIR